MAKRKNRRDDLWRLRYGYPTMLTEAERFIDTQRETIGRLRSWIALLWFVIAGMASWMAWRA